MKKVIHYCWFGEKPLPKLAKKCIKSWKKFLPDYEIMKWNENNFDINITTFSKKAYEEKKWAFVSDVARIYALKEYGGIYFDTDMIVHKDINEILESEAFAGWESDLHVAVGVLGAREKDNELINKLWEFYCKNEFSVENMYSLSIPVILTNILLTEYGLKYDSLHNQELKGGIKIFARDYFYPIPSDKDSVEMFTDNTCMIHYYVGSWLSESEKKRAKFQTIFGKKLGSFILEALVLCKRVLRKTGKLVLYPLVIRNRKKLKNYQVNAFSKDLCAQLENIQNNDYIVFYNKNWIGTMNATKELFNNIIGIEEIDNEEVLKVTVENIINKKISLVVFSAFARGWEQLAIELKRRNPSMTLKIIWHGSHAMNVEDYDWEMFETIFRLLEGKIINSIAFVKKSMYDLYKAKGYNVEFLYNTVHVQKKEMSIKDKSEKIKIGLYASGDRWVKNFYNQLAAASLFENAIIDCIPINNKIIKMSRILNVVSGGLRTNIPREKMLGRMSENDINFYVTFSECAPLIPIESLELGVPCITGNNHHYWEGTELEDYLIVNESDDVLKIYEKANYALENKDKILNIYKKWKKEYDKKSMESVNKFLEKRD